MAKFDIKGWLDWLNRSLLGRPLRKTVKQPTPTIVNLRLDENSLIDDELRVGIACNFFEENCCVIDWGDGTIEDDFIWFGPDDEGLFSFSRYHAYPALGDYQVKIIPKRDVKIILGSTAGLVIERGTVNSVSIGSGVERIRSSAFDSQFYMESCYIPDFVTEIGDYAFRDCELLNLSLPKSIARIGLCAFSRCKSLPENLEIFAPTVHAKAYEHCTSLRKVWIRESVVSLGFADSSGVEIGGALFTGCDESLVIYCEANEKPDGWFEDFNSRNQRMPDGNHIIGTFTTIWGQKTCPW